MFTARLCRCSGQCPRPPCTPQLVFPPPLSDVELSLNKDVTSGRQIGGESHWPNYAVYWDLTGGECGTVTLWWRRNVLSVKRLCCLFFRLKVRTVFFSDPVHETPENTSRSVCDGMCSCISQQTWCRTGKQEDVVGQRVLNIKNQHFKVMWCLHSLCALFSTHHIISRFDLSAHDESQRSPASWRLLFMCRQRTTSMPVAWWFSITQSRTVPLLWTSQGH